MDQANHQLPPGSYPFADGEYPLEAMAFTDAPPELETFLKRSAEAAGVAIIRDRPVELACKTPDGLNPRFIVWWPHGSERLHILTPTGLIRGRA